jgi:hypothetical protein
MFGTWHVSGSGWGRWSIENLQMGLCDSGHHQYSTRPKFCGHRKNLAVDRRLRCRRSPPPLSIGAAHFFELPRSEASFATFDF